VTTYALGSAVSATMVFGGSFHQLPTLGTLQGVVGASAGPASDVLPPRLVAAEDLLAANALLGGAEESSIAFGPLVAATAIGLCWETRRPGS
jgi:hypothetical protein